jgi:hypothetical protein
VVPGDWEREMPGLRREVRWQKGFAWTLDANNRR